MKLLWGVALAALMLLSGASRLSARTLYVSSSSGNDANSGLAPETPVRTLARASSMLSGPGDQLLLKRGDSWRETLNFAKSGTPSSPIVVGPYGTGARPLILGSDPLSEAVKWTQESPFVWYAAGISWSPKAVFHLGAGGRRRANKSELAADWDWWYDEPAQRLYCRLGTNPGLSSVEVTRRNGIGWGWVNYVTIQGLEIAYADFGVGIYGGDNWVMDDLYVHDIAVDAIHANGGARFGIVRNCVIQDWNWNGYKAAFGSGESQMGYGVHVQDGATTGSDGWIVADNELNLVNMESNEDTTAIAFDTGGHASSIRGNRISGKPSTEMSGIFLWRPRGSGPVTIEDNRISNVGAMGINASEFNAFGFKDNVAITRNIIFNACGRDVLDQEALRVWTSTSSLVSVSNNLVAGTRAGLNTHHGIRIRQSRAVVSENTVYGTDTGISIERNSPDIMLFNNISSGNRIAALSVDGTSTCTEYNNNLHGAIRGVAPASSSINASPVFVNTTAGDFHLTKASPAINAGAFSPNSMRDLDGVTRPAGGAWDMGAYEYVPQVEISLDPPAATLGAGQTVQFRALVSGTADTSVSWSIKPQVGSMSSAGLYRAPQNVTSAQTVTVTARSGADPLKAATATVILAPNLLRSGDFESGNLTGWENYGGIAVTAAAKFAGKYGARMNQSGRIDQRFKTTAGKSYTVNARIRIDRQVVTPPWGGLRVQVVDAGWNELATSGFLTTTNSPAGTWLSITLTFVARTAESRIVYQNFGTGKFEASADDFSVY